MPNRPAIQRGSAREAAVLESIRQGHSQRAACAAAGVAERSFYRHLERSAAFQHDVQLAQAEAERRLTAIVLDAAATDAKHAEWLLARRWPDRYGDRTAVDMSARIENQYDTETLALAARYSHMTDQEVEAEIRRLAWAAPATEQPGAAMGSIALTGDGRERSDDGVGTAMPLLPSTPATRDETPDVAADGTVAREWPKPPLVVDPGADRPAPCPHCAGDALRHKPNCSTFTSDGMVQHRLTPMAVGDPR